MLQIIKHFRRTVSSVSKIELKPLTTDHYDELVEHLRRNFLPDEPLSAAVDLGRRGEGNTELERYSHKLLEENLSQMAVNEAGELVGVLINSVANETYVDSMERRLDKCCDVNYKAVLSFLNMVNRRADIFLKFNVDKIFDIRLLSVDKRYRGKGISDELLKKSEKMARDKNFKYMKADATSVYAQDIFKRNGYRILQEYPYSKWIDRTGEQILKVPRPHTKVELYIKPLLDALV